MYIIAFNNMPGFCFALTIFSGHSPLELITSYTSLVGRLSPLPKWVGQGAVLGLQGGTDAVQKTLFRTVVDGWGNLSDVAAVWLQDWTGQRNFSGTNDLPRVGLWWNWEVGIMRRTIERLRILRAYSGCGLLLLLQVDDSHHPGWTQMISSLRSKGIKTLTYINPLFGNISQRGIV